MKNIPLDYIEKKHLTPDLRKEIKGGEQTINNYTTNVINNIISKFLAVQVVSDTNITLNNTTTIIDGLTLVVGDLILCANQTDSKENGIYQYYDNFVRIDFNAGDLVVCLKGDNYSNSLWKNYNDNILIGTTNIVFKQLFDIDKNVTANGVLFDNDSVANNEIGFLGWDSVNETLTLNLKNDTKLQLGQELYYRVKNVQGATIENGQMVYAYGTSGNSGNINVKLGTADGSINARYFLGVATQNIDNDDFGFVTYFGLVRGMQTDGANYGETWVDGDVLYVSSTIAGGLTNVRPTTPNEHIIVAMVINSHDSNGSLFVRVNNGLYLGDLHDVYTNGVTDGQVLTWNDSNQRYEPMDVEGLPDGTGGEMLINESGEWLPKGNLAITAGGTTTFDYDMKSYGTLDTRFIRFRVKDGDGAYIYLNTTSGTGPRVTLAAESNDTKLELLFNSNNITTLNTFAGSIITATRAGTVRFGVTSTGVILSNSLTPSTLLQANASKEIVSIPKVTVTDDGTNRIIKMLNNSDVERIGIYGNETNPSIILLSSTSGSTISITAGTSPFVGVTKGTLTAAIATNAYAFDLTNSATRLFSVDLTGKIKSNTLTPSTLLQSNASKEIVSIANNAGYLKNDGAGALTYEAISGLLPAGTGGKMLINESGEWLPKGNLAITAGGTTTFDYDMKSYGTLDTRFIRFRVKDGDGAYIYLNTTSGTGPRVTLTADSNNTNLELLFSSNSSTLISGSTGNIISATRSGNAIFYVTSTGRIFSRSLTASTLLQANANNDITSIANNAGYLKNDGAGAFTYSSPNIIKYNTALISDTLGNWTNIPTLTFSLGANVTYELELYLSLGNNAGRNGSIRIDSTSANFTFRPFIIGNSNGANPAVIYINDSTATQPFNLDNSTELQVQNADSGSIVMLKGIITSSVNIPNATIQIKTRDVGSAFQCKEYSYIKLSR